VQAHRRSDKPSRTCNTCASPSAAERGLRRWRHFFTIPFVSSHLIILLDALYVVYTSNSVESIRNTAILISLLQRLRSAHNFAYILPTHPRLVLGPLSITRLAESGLLTMSFNSRVDVVARDNGHEREKTTIARVATIETKRGTKRKERNS